MHDVLFQAIQESVSEARLTPYGSDGALQSTVLARYLWNMALSESLYPALNGLEVVLRNSLHNAITEFQGNEYWFDSTLNEKYQQKPQEVRDRIHAQNRTPTADRIVAGFDFGFWTHLFNSHYDGKIWPRLLQRVFPNMTGILRTRRELNSRLNKFRRLRNRVFHHEPIWNSKDLPVTHQQILEVIGWISPEMQALVQSIDRFPEIHSTGVPGYEALILQVRTTG